jgi:protein-S-isoprenylcysteine O-methyltransferase Ste14
VLAGAAAASVIVIAGGGTPDACLLASLTGVLFGDLARRAGRERGRQKGDSTDAGTALSFLAVLTGAAFDVGRGSLDGDEAQLHALAGVLLIVLGVVLREWSVRVLGRSFAVRLGVADDHRLVDAGPYRWIRHPNYAALLIVALGTALALSSPVAAIATFTVWLPVTILRVTREERLLLAHYGERYEAYRRRSARLVPGVY